MCKGIENLFNKRIDNNCALPPAVPSRLLCRAGVHLSKETLVQGHSVSFCLDTSGDLLGYTPDEKLRQQQLQELRRQWIKDQELSPRELVLPPEATWPKDRFWDKFWQIRPLGGIQSIRIFPGDTVVETGELIPPMKEFPDQHH
uniref:NADH dehydrogenase [ubiquinone] 1 beta subcomplex subunit 6 n=1 Tax=Callithrix jacchus TaxID=9483 RepID=A0A5F4VW88_CALJA